MRSVSLLWILYWIIPIQSDDLSSFGILSYQIVRAIHDERRSPIEGDRQLRLELDHKNLTLVLRQVEQFFPFDADLHFGSSTYLPLNTSILYEGYVSDHLNTSFVSGGFYSNWFDGTIQLFNETWHVEPMEKYGVSSTRFRRSIIYNTLDVDVDRYESSQRVFRSKQERMKEELNRLVSDDLVETRKKRQASNNVEHSCCHLYIRIDPTLWDLVYQHEGLQERQATIHALVTFLFRTVTAANRIYRSVNFQSNGDALRRFTLRIKRIRILTPDDCQQTNLTLSERNLCVPHLDSNVLLTWHSAENFSEYCLAYLFAARDFGDGTLGLAWIGSVAENSRGGICQRPARDIYEGQRVIKTLNTGLVTVINHHNRISALMAELAFAHEVGHSLGAEHDDETCSGDARNGHFIMYRCATTGLENNNDLFSNCSLERMSRVVIAVKNQLMGKSNCFTDCSQVGYCGNRNVEENEDCDCGFLSECTDPCCYPADGPDSNLACRLKPTAHCSPSKGPCCSAQCTFHSQTHICHRDQTGEDCLGDVRCDGLHAVCPLNDTQFFKPVDAPCNQYTALCDRGECNKSVCTFIDQEECSLTGAEPSRQRVIDREYLCHIGCFDARTNTCADSFALRMINNRSSTGFGYKYQAGHACAGTMGYCDVFGQCRLVDAEGPLSRLKKMLLNEETLHTFTEVVRHHWWALLFALIGLLSLLSIVVKLCSVHTPSFRRRRHQLPIPSSFVTSSL